MARRATKGAYTTKTHDSGLFEFMVGKGLDPLIEDENGRSSLDVAAACGQKEIPKVFQYRS
jgi:ankyrin repeat protein